MHDHYMKCVKWDEKFSIDGVEFCDVDMNQP